MKVTLARIWKEDDAVLAFEWVLLVTLLTIGIVGGLAAARDAITDELADVALAMLSVDQSYIIQPSLTYFVHAPPSVGDSGMAGSEFIDGFLFSECDRASVAGQDSPVIDGI